METLFLVCVPESWDHAPSSTTEPCSECGQSVWVSQSGKKAAVQTARGAPVTVICLDCAARHTDPEVLQPTPEQIESVRGEIHRRAEMN